MWLRQENWTFISCGIRQSQGYWFEVFLFRNDLHVGTRKAESFLCNETEVRGLFSLYSHILHHSSSAQPIINYTKVERPPFICWDVLSCCVPLWRFTQTSTCSQSLRHYCVLVCFLDYRQVVELADKVCNVSLLMSISFYTFSWPFQFKNTINPPAICLVISRFQANSSYIIPETLSWHIL